MQGIIIHLQIMQLNKPKTTSAKHVMQCNLKQYMKINAMQK